MTYSSSGNDFENLLSGATDAIIHGQKLAAEIRQIPEMMILLPLIRTLKHTYRPYRPARHYSARLRHDLVGGEQYTVIERVRYLPPRVQIAAFVAIVAGALVLLRGRSMVLSQSALTDATTA
jgi:hypothetical protein